MVEDPEEVPRRYLLCVRHQPDYFLTTAKLEVKLESNGEVCNISGYIMPSTSMAV